MRICVCVRESPDEETKIRWEKKFFKKKEK